MKKFLVWAGAILGGLALCLAGLVGYVKNAAAERLSQKMDVAVESIPIPYPLTSDEEQRLLQRLGRPEALTKTGAADDAGSQARQTADTPSAETPAQTADAATAATQPQEDASAHAAVLEAVGAEANPEAPSAAAPQPAVPELSQAQRSAALEAEALRLARKRGERYLSSRAACAECHGEDFGGKVIIDALPVMARWIAPNITRGGVTRDFTPADWVRIIRHGVRRDGQVTTMPARDFTWLSDQEISDIVAYIQSLPPVDRVMPPSELGPVFSMLIVKGDIPVDAEHIDHQAPRPKLPPELAVTVELGQHLATTCEGCHGPHFAGGPIPGGDPSWPAASNLTPHATGLQGWSLGDFTRALRDGKRPDGTQLNRAMPIPYTKNLADEEVAALYLFLQKLPPLERGSR